MKAIELIQILAKGFIPIEQCGTFTANDNDLSRLVDQFGRGVNWYGRFSAGEYFYVWQPSEDDPILEDADLRGYYSDEDKGVWYVYKVTNN